MAEKKVVTKKKKVKKVVPAGRAYVKATFNNTIISFTDPKGNVLCWETAGASGFKGTKKSTPYAAQMAVSRAAEVAKATYGLEKVDVYVKGIGAGRDSAVRAINASGIYVNLIKDITPLPHNGTRAKKPRRT